MVINPFSLISAWLVYLVSYLMLVNIMLTWKGGYTVLSTKGVASLLSYTLFQALTFPVTYLLAAVLVFTAVMQIKYVNRALQRFDATQVIPTQFVMFTLSVIIGSAVLYRDFERTPGEDAGKFVGGCALTFVGVWLITSARPVPSDDDDEFDDEDDEAIVLRAGEQYQDDGIVNGSQSSIRHSLVDSVSDLENGPTAAALGGSHSKVSLPESLEWNHWDATQSESTTPGRPSLSVVGPSSPDSLVDGSPLEENPWQSGTQTPAVKPRSSFRRLLEPFTSIFPNSESESLPPSLEARHSAPDLPAGIESTATTPRTRSSSQGDGHLEASFGTSLPTHHTQPHLLPRNSLSSLYPGPFTSPLSSSLSAVVADSIRRRVRLRPRRSARARLPTRPNDTQTPRTRGNSEPPDAAAALETSIRAGLNGATPSRRRGRTGDDDDDADLESEPATPSYGRRKSLGDRLGGLFRSKRAKITTPSRGVGSDESGPSNAEDQV
jgi:magnesium transporter